MPDTHKEFEKKNPNFGTKVDFFPIGKIGIWNVPNFNNFISPKLNIEKKIIKIGEPFFSRKKCQIHIRNLKKKNPNFGKKVDFFPLSEKKLEFFPNTKKNNFP